MARQRDYAAEYQQRLARAEARGLTHKQARGHGGDRPRRAVGPLPPQASAIYTTERGAAGYLSRLGANRKAKLVAVYEDGGSVIIRGRHGGRKPADLLDQDTLDRLAEARERYARSRAAQADQGETGMERGVPVQRSQLIGYQVIWQ